LKPQILIIDDDSTFRGDLILVMGEKFDCCEVENSKEALDRLSTQRYDVVLLDLMLGDRESGLDLLDKIFAIDSGIPIIMITEHASVDSAVEAMKKGAFTYISKTTRADELIEILNKAIQSKKVLEQAKNLREEINKDYYRIVGESTAIYALQRKIELFAKNPQTVLIQGESGTGKELVARQIHQKSEMKNRPFVAVNCAAIPKDLIESELFGHEAGAFTGAKKRKIGKLESAADGIIFFDEIGELDLNAQSKLLRVLEEKEFQRVGGIRSLKTSAKVISATNRDLEESIKDGTFREDLFYRLEILTINVPPLRERKSDIGLLIDHFLKKICFEMKSSQKTFDDEAMKACMDYDWPGNVRELRNAVSSSAIISEGDIIKKEHLNRRIISAYDKGSKSIELIPKSWEEMDLMRRDAADKAGREIEKNYLKYILEKYDGNIANAAKNEGLNRSNFYRMMKRCNLA